MPDGFNSLGTDDWVAPRLSSLGVNDWLQAAPPPEPPPPPPPAPPPSSTLGGVGKALAQAPSAIIGRLAGAEGAGVTSIGTGLQSAARNADAVERSKIALMDRIDGGEQVKPVAADLGSLAATMNEFGEAYSASSPDMRAKVRAKIEGSVATPPEDTGLGQAGGAVKSLGESIRTAGQATIEAGEAAHPLTDEEKSRLSVRGVKLVEGLAPYVVAGFGGPEAIAALAGLEGFGSHYDAAKKAGSTDEEAATTALFGGISNAALMTVPIGKAFEVAAQLPNAFRGAFFKTVGEVAKSSATGVTFTQIQTVADNVLAQQTYDPTRPITQDLGKDLGLQAAVFGALPLGIAGAGAAARLAGRALSGRPNVQPRPPRPAVEDVLNAPDLDTAIDAANQVASTPSAEAPPVVAPEVRTPADIGAETDPDQAKLLRLFDNTGKGTVEQAEDGGYHFRTTDAAGTEITHPIEVWHPETDPDASAIPLDTVNALRDHYGQAGVDVVFYKDHGAIPFDGAADPAQPDTIFLSSNPARNIAQVAGHEFTHVLQSTTLPDGSSLQDLLHQQIAAGLTPAGRNYARATFGSTAPDRAGFADDASHAAAFEAHLINEMGADIGGEAPKFQSFLPRVVDAIQQRFGDTVAGDVLGKLIAGLRSAMETVRGLFGETGTRSQIWVTNIGEIHDTLAKMYAARFGSPVEREQAALAAMRDRAERDRTVAATAAPESTVTPEAPAPTEAGGQGDLRTAGYERNPDDALAGRIEHIKERLADTSLSDGARKEFTRRVRDFEQFIAKREEALAGAAPEHAAAVRGMRVDDLVTGKTSEGDSVTGVISGFGKDGRVGVSDADGLRYSIPVHEITRVERTGGQPVAVKTAIETPKAAEPAQPPTPVAPAADDGAMRDARTTLVLQLRRWLDELAAERDAKAAATPQAKLLTQTEKAILRPVEGDETALPDATKTRLDDVRAKIDEVTHPTADTPEMAKVRARIRTIGQIQAEDGVGPRAAAATQEAEIAAAGRPITAEEAAARKAGVQPTEPPASRQPLPYVPVPREPVRLIDYLRRPTVLNKGTIHETTIPGGVIDTGGDVGAIIGGVRGRPGLISGRGRTLDDATLQAWEDGYFPEHDQRPEINHLLDAIRDDHTGTVRYSDADREAVQAHQAAVAQNAEIDRLAHEHDLPTRGLTHDQFFDAVLDRMSVAEQAREMQSQADAHEAAMKEWTERARQETGTPADQWTNEHFLQQHIGRSLEDLEREDRQEADTRAAARGAEGVTGRGPVAGDQGAGEEGGGPRGGVAGPGRGDDTQGAGEGSAGGVAFSPRRLPLPPQAGTDLLGRSTPDEIRREYIEADTAVRVGHPAMQAATDAYRARKIGDAEYLAARQAHDALLARFDRAAQAMQSLPPERVARTAEPTIRNDRRQTDMFGTGDAAVQAQAARDQAGRGALLPKGEQKPADEGLFAPDTSAQRPLFSPRQTDTPEFRRWFGASKVVDAGGRPLVVYHGTKSDFEAFDPSKVGSNNDPGMWGSGFYFSPDPKMSEAYGSTLLPVYVSLKNPLIVRQASRLPLELQPVRGDAAKSNKLRETILGMGHDGVMHYETGDTPKLMQVVAFDPTQIKSAIGNSGTFDPNDARIQFSPRREEDRVPLYSALTRAVEGVRQEKATPGQWIATLKNMPGVKPEERAWTGLDDWLNKQPKSVTKGEVLDYLRANSLDVREVMHGEPTEPPDIAAKRERFQALIDRDEAHEQRRGPSLTADEQAEMDGLLGELSQRVNPHLSATRTRFDQYQLPGGQNYRELLITLPEDTRRTDQLDAEARRLEAAGDPRWREVSAERGRLMREQTPYRGSHWDEANVLAHARFSERDAPDGAKVLHVEEVQSDLHQAGRKQGYRGKEDQSRLTAIDAEQERMIQGVVQRDSGLNRYAGGMLESRAYERMTPTERARYDVLTTERGREADQLRANRSAVPDAPFKTTWPMLAMKRIIQFAVDHGFDRVAWTPGDVQNARYPDAKRPAEAMRGFYDKMLPTEVQKIVGKFGAKVGQSEIDAGEFKVNRDSHDPPFRLERQNSPDIISRHATADEAWAAAERLGAQPVHSFDITPQLREAVQTQGLPLFSPRQRVAVRNERETERWTPAELAAYSHVGRVVEAPTFRDRLAAMTSDLGRRTVRYWLDPYIGVKADDPAGYMALRNANTTAGATEMFLTDGTLRFSGSTYAMDQRNGGVEHNLVRPLHGEQDRFLWWVAANRADRLSAEDRENLWSQDDIDTIKATNQGQVPFDYTLPDGTITRSREAVYLDSLRKLDVFNKNVLDLGVQSGLLDGDRISALYANPFYVPFYRVAEDDGHFAGPNLTSGFVKQNAFKTLKGGTQKLNNDLWDNAIKNWSHMIDASLRNRAASGVLDTAVTNGAATEVSERDLATMTKAERKSTVWVMNNGNRQSFQVTDPLLYTAISALDFSGFRNPVMNAATKFKTMLTMGVTADPRFMLRVSIRDAEQAIATAPMSYNIAKNVMTGYGMADLPGAMQNVARAVAGRELRRLDLGQEAADAIAGGGTMRLGSGHDTGGRTTDLDTMLDRPDTINAFWHRVSQIARAYKEVTAQAEDTQRFALYHKLIAEGVPHDQAAYAARDLEDFTLKGAGAIARVLTQTVPFMNAWAQGLYKVGRAATDQDRNLTVAVGQRLAASTAKRVAVVLGTSALMTVALDAIYADDEDYKKRPDYDRDANFWFKFGGVQFRIPMGFEIAAMSRIAANGAEAIFGLNEMTGRRFANSVLQILGTNMSMSPVPQIVRPALDLLENQTGTGSPIVGMGMDRLRSEEQYTGATTLLARAASSAGSAAARFVGGPQAQFLAPIQIDYLVNGYFGWLGSHVMNLADLTARGIDQAQAALRDARPMEPVRPNVDMWNYATGGMVSTAATPQSRYVDLLYQQAEGVRRAYATYHDLIARGRPDDARAFYAANKDQISKYGLVEKVTELEAMANRQIKRIGESPTLSAEQKRIEIMRYNAMRNRAAENVFGTRPSP